MTKENLLNLLRVKEVLVSFIKNDGTRREMFCTLKPDVIPEVHGSSGQKNENHIVVYDLEKQGWRTLNLENGWEIIL